MPAQAAERCKGEALRPTSSNALAVEHATLCLIDGIRAAHHLPALRMNNQLVGVAISQVATMVAWDYFSDVRPTGQTPLSLIDVTGYPAKAADVAVGQNIAWGTGNYSTPAHIVAEWMASTPHRQIILTGAYRDAGVAVKPGVPAVVHPEGHPGATYAMEFAVRRY
jgi:uncharacterized protein YkwD